MCLHHCSALHCYLQGVHSLVNQSPHCCAMANAADHLQCQWMTPRAVPSVWENRHLCQRRIFPISTGDMILCSGRQMERVCSVPGALPVGAPAPLLWPPLFPATYIPNRKLSLLCLVKDALHKAVQPA